MEKLELLYEGKAKKVYKTSDPSLLIMEFKDDATAFDGKKKGVIEDKGILNCRISTIFFELLGEKGIDTHFVKRLNDREMLVKSVKILPIEVIVRNIAAGSMAKRYGIEEGFELKRPVLEFCLKDDRLGDPMINNYHLIALGIAREEQLKKIEEMAFNVNNILKEYLMAKGILLVDFKLEFGEKDGNILLADEISPDTCRFWDINTKEKLDKDRFRRDLGNIIEAYREVYSRLKN
ncbi:phosphoribosylaminoimidazolesuccinocarboxamide synthase [Thermovenabulum gondwanense]|uniref:Phosphoribosylaminoimidazole-succinocarboxamide synthase n=1 Tax=Thermovenabulum gondwanense TaxID=520767 RepID=A0A162MJF0_9FIRM|nr:phosphoribosylaminoimidazolesuccinocarboxamide synthase [Thermovenabulum gondwanense]KYO66361.1 Phosphoribosylaminoimidazole-succinocarboxamide synthase [Thermovenabulum gondwanense]